MANLKNICRSTIDTSVYYASEKDKRREKIKLR